MNPDSSLFTPGQPVSAEFFTGRMEQVKELLTMVRMARTKGLQVGWISGERGMGKSSLASFIGYLAERNEKAVVAHVHLGGIRDLEGLVREAHLQLLKDNENKSWGKALWGAFGERVERVGIFGTEIKLNIPQDELSATASSFSDSLGHILKNTTRDREVMVLIFDDINGLADNPDFAHWLKSMVDSEATSRRDNRVCLIFAGLEERRRQLEKINPSVIRIFRPLIDIQPWTPQESMDFFESSFAKGNCVVEEDVLEQLARYSGGLPIMAHELGHAIWEILENKEIDDVDVLTGAITAAKRIGGRFLKHNVIQALQSKHYRSILGKIAQHTHFLEIEFSKEQLRSLPLTADEKKKLDNFINRMRKLGAIVLVEDGRRGVYRFATYLHRLYFFLEASVLANGKHAT